MNWWSTRKWTLGIRIEGSKLDSYTCNEAHERSSRSLGLTQWNDGLLARVTRCCTRTLIGLFHASSQGYLIEVPASDRISALPSYTIGWMEAIVGGVRVVRVELGDRFPFVARFVDGGVGTKIGR